ncbi:hypothetical protein D5018_20980 [Parashewanella curva]|uniref:Uncharacterized protein n=1 Tax=Parashewanella curva TaxID=2338552 RepID=A0A3L8PRA3_9GAMM|nr:hypothetical protein [Parashewanella curva]RLV57734.1 hypothetical protein D5018_20980 [Parashewanella curva]
MSANNNQPLMPGHIMACQSAPTICKPQTFTVVQEQPQVLEVNSKTFIVGQVPEYCTEGASFYETKPCEFTVPPPSYSSLVIECLENNSTESISEAQKSEVPLNPVTVTQPQKSPFILDAIKMKQLGKLEMNGCTYKIANSFCCRTADITCKSLCLFSACLLGTTSVIVTPAAITGALSVSGTAAIVFSALGSGGGSFFGSILISTALGLTYRYTSYRLNKPVLEIANNLMTELNQLLKLKDEADFKLGFLPIALRSKGEKYSMRDPIAIKNYKSFISAREFLMAIVNGENLPNGKVATFDEFVPCEEYTTAQKHQIGHLIKCFELYDAEKYNELNQYLKDIPEKECLVP